jgi:hypothetical protein
MTTQDLGHDLGHGLAPHPTDEDQLGALFESSPARPVHTSAAAETAFLAGLVALVGAPFSLMTAVSLGLSALALVTSVVGLARSSRPRVAGSLLASVGLVLSLATLALIGLRYLGIDTTVGDAALPTLVDWLGALNDLVPRP